MKGMIDVHGYLYIERGGTMRATTCQRKLSNCRDTCVLFGEPVYRWDEKKESNVTSLAICEKVFEFDSFKDRRGTKDE